MQSRLRQRHWSKANNRPHRADDIIDRATKLLSQGANRGALKILRAAVMPHTSDAAILTRYADALYLSGRIAEARDNYRDALTLEGTLFQAWYGLGCAELSFEAYASAIACFRRAVELQPRDREAHLYLGKALFHIGEVDAAIDELQIAAKSKDPKLRCEALRQIAVIIPGSPLRGNSHILKARGKWARLQAEREQARAGSPSGRHKPNSRLRVGYVSAFFGARNWMKPVWGMIHAHDRSLFEVHLFLDRGQPSATSGYRRHRSDVVHVITGVSNEVAAERIARTGIDILVDLNGYSFPDRLGLFIRRPARAIIGWFSMYATTGIPAFDYIIGDASVVPAGEEKYYTERVLRVPGSYLAFSVPYPVPPVSPPPCLRAGLITFGCLAPQYKITDEMIASWARILSAVRRARLLLKNSFLGDRSNRDAVLARFDQHGITQERVLVEGPTKHYEFLKAYARVDIVLDSFPYNGGTTTAEALWQGVPVLTFRGDRWASRISCSLLVAAGLNDWVLPSCDAYVERAIKLALSPETPRNLTTIRKAMREHLLRSPVCNTSALCREIERHYLDIIRAGRANSHPCAAATLPGPKNQH